jgi:hypothetical protein
MFKGVPPRKPKRERENQQERVERVNQVFSEQIENMVFKQVENQVFKQVENQVFKQVECHDNTNDTHKLKDGFIKQDTKGAVWGFGGKLLLFKSALHIKSLDFNPLDPLDLDLIQNRISLLCKDCSPDELLILNQLDQMIIPKNQVVPNLGLDSEPLGELDLLIFTGQLSLAFDLALRDSRLLDSLLIGHRLGSPAFATAFASSQNATHHERGPTISFMYSILSGNSCILC